MSGLCAHLRAGGAAGSEVLEAMVAAAPYRAAAGVRRLRLDPFGGAVLASRREDRPWVSADGRLAVVADARLHGRAALTGQLVGELEQDLALPGAGAGLPDAALLAAAWRRWGEGLVDRLDGDFAFVLWDADQRLLLAARDAAGSRPLVWSRTDGGACFASEPRQLLAARRLHGEPRTVDEVAAAAFLALDFHPTGRTLVAGLHRLPPGHRLCLRWDGPSGTVEGTPQRWWCPERATVVSPRTPRGWAEAFREALERAVGGRLGRVGGTPGVLLSGGLDSSSVAAVLAHLGRPADLLTHVFPSFPECDESAFASAAAEHWGAPLHRLSAERDLVPSEVAALRGPGGGAAGLPDEPWTAAQEQLSGALLDLARQRLGEAGPLFTGFGGDSLFDAARWRYRDDVRRGRWWRLGAWIADRRRRGASWPRAVGGIVVKPLLPPPLLRALDHRGRRAAGGAWRLRHAPPWVPPDLVARTGLTDRLAGRQVDAAAVPRRYRGVRQVQYAHLLGLAQQAVTLDALETCAARRGLELFHPLLDRRLAELVLAAPLELGAVPGRAGSKHLLRQALGADLPPMVRQRADKAGWGPYLAHLLRGETGRRAAALVPGGAAEGAGLVDGAVWRRELERFRAGAGPYGHGLWFLPPLLLELWLRAGQDRGASSGEVAA